MSSRELHSDPILKITDLTVTFGTQKSIRPAVSQLNIEIIKGQCLGLVGESGSGKSMTSLAIMQLLPPTAYVGTQSRILYQNRDLLSIPERQMRTIRGKKIALIFQDAMSAFNPVLTVGHQITEVITRHLNYSSKQSKKFGYQLLNEVGIEDHEHYFQAYPHELSGGMRQRAMIAMALSGKPELLIADEPTTSLDVTLQAQILDLLNQLKQKHNMTLLFISHDLSLIARLADEVVVLKKGEKIEQANAKQFFENPTQEYSKLLLEAILPITPRYTDFAPQPPLLKTENLKIYFPIRSKIIRRTIGHIKAVDGVDFEIPQGQTLALVGESGSGKTTTAKAIIQLIKPTQGNIFFENELIRNDGRFNLSEKMQIVFQDPYTSLDPRMIIFDSIAEGLYALNKVKNRNEAEAQVDEMLAHVGISASAKWRYPHEFSGGERQRLCIARAMALNPKLLILDEPTSALDVSIQLQILQLLEQLQEKRGLSYLLITHNLSVVAYMAHYVAVMYRGKIIEYGRTSEILTNPKHNYTKSLLEARS